MLAVARERLLEQQKPVPAEKKGEETATRNAFRHRGAATA